MIQTREAVEPIDLLQAIDRAAVEPICLLGGVLDLQPGFYMFDRCGDEGDRGARHHARHGVSYGREFMDGCIWEGEVALGETAGRGGHAVGVEEGLVEDAAVEGQGAEHDAVHEHPAYERRRGSLVEAREALFSDGEEETLEGP